MLTMSKQILNKEELTFKALQYDKNKQFDRSIVFMKGFREAVKMCLPFIQDSFRSKIENLIK